MNFPSGKIEFWTHWEIYAYHRIFGFWKSPEISKNKGEVHITNLRSIYNFKKSHAVNIVILFGFLYFWRLLWHWKLTFVEHWMNFWLSGSGTFCFLGDLLKPRFLLDASIFTRIDEEKGMKINSSTIFEGICLNLGQKIWEFINTVD